MNQVGGLAPKARSPLEGLGRASPDIFVLIDTRKYI